MSSLTDYRDGYVYVPIEKFLQHLKTSKDDDAGFSSNRFEIRDAIDFLTEVQRRITSHGGKVFIELREPNATYSDCLYMFLPKKHVTDLLGDLLQWGHGCDEYDLNPIQEIYPRLTLDDRMTINPTKTIVIRAWWD